MNTRHVTCLATILALGMYVGAQAKNPTSGQNVVDPGAQDIAAIIALEQRDAAAANINDVETLVSLWTPDGVLLHPNQTRSWVFRLSANARSSETADGNDHNARLPGKLEGRRILGNEAYEWGEMSVTAKLPNGQAETQRVLAIRILRRQPDGSWKFARASITPAALKD